MYESSLPLARHGGQAAQARRRSIWSCLRLNLVYFHFAHEIMSRLVASLKPTLHHPLSISASFEFY